MALRQSFNKLLNPRNSNVVKHCRLLGQYYPIDEDIFGLTQEQIQVNLVY